MNKSSCASDPNQTTWRYPTTDRRDLRIDFLRGIAMIIMVVAHIEVFSVFNLFTSERFGLVSGAEGFVIFAGIVLGSLYRYRLPLDGWTTSIFRLWSRAWKLYTVSLFIILSIYLIGLLPIINAHEVLTFTNRGLNIVYPLYPVNDVPLNTALNFLFYLQAGPHQTQVLGLYVVLMLITPIAFAAFYYKKHGWFLLVSWLVYFWSQKHSDYHLLHSNFENAFSVLAWQALFFSSLAIGWFKAEISSYMYGWRKQLLLSFCIMTSLGLFFIAQNHTNPFLPDWAHLRVINAGTFDYIYNTYALKNSLGMVRVLNDFCLLVTLYWLLTICWKPFYKAFGWYLIPVGQASLYVFIIHVYVVLLVSQLVSFSLQPNNWLIATVVHGGSLWFLWWMTKKEIGMKYIPN